MDSLKQQRFWFKYPVLRNTLVISLLILVLLWVESNVQNETEPIVRPAVFEEDYDIIDSNTAPAVQVDLFIKECDCHKLVKVGEIVNGAPIRCNTESNLVGKGQKVVSYALFGNNSIKKYGVPNITFKYEDGVRARLEDVRKLYPGWVMRLYTEFDLSEHAQFCDLVCNEADFFWCDVNKMTDSDKVLSSNGMVWRFTPIDDDVVDKFLSRDLDSLILVREREAVKEWEESDKTFHFIRDHKAHTVGILGGMWGAKVSQLGQEDRTYLYNKLIQGSSGIGIDQSLLKQFLYTPRFFNISMAHDAFYCERFTQTECRNNPMPRIGKEYIGNAGFDFI